MERQTSRAGEFVSPLCWMVKARHISVNLGTAGSHGWVWHRRHSQSAGLATQPSHAMLPATNENKYKKHAHDESSGDFSPTEMGKKNLSVTPPGQVEGKSMNFPFGQIPQLHSTRRNNEKKIKSICN
jgi:hypothetical protein